MPKYIRIDERLIHGQILQKWLEYTGCRSIYVINDETAKDPIIQSVLLMTVPESVHVEFLDEQAGAERIEDEEGSVLILLKSLESLWRLYSLGAAMERVNVCRLPYMTGKKRICQNLYISDKEEDILRSMLRDGVDIFVQAVPDNEEVHMEDLLD